MDIPLLNRLKKPKEKKEIEEEIKELNKRKAQLRSELKRLKDLERDASDVKEQMKELESELTDRYNALAEIEYNQALKELGEETEEKKVTLSRMKGELKEEKKEREKLEEKLEEAQEKIQSLREGKKELAKKINELREEIRDKKMKIEQKQDIIEELEGEEIERKLKKEPEETEDTEKEKPPREKLLESIVDKYSDHIDEEEKRTIQELREMVQPNNISLREFLSEVSEGQETLEACEEAYKKIMKEVKSCEPLDVEYWMTIKTMLDTGAAEYKDKAILMCSAFRHFGADAYVSIAKLDNNEKRPLNEIKLNGNVLIIDPNHKHPFKKYYGSMDEVKEQYKHEGHEIKEFEYRFNDKEYITG